MNNFLRSSDTDSQPLVLCVAYFSGPGTVACEGLDEVIAIR